MTDLNSELKILTKRPQIGKEVCVQMVIQNISNKEEEILNPYVGKIPENIDWEFSEESYTVSVLMSYNYLVLNLLDANQNPIKRKMNASWVTPIISSVKIKPNKKLKFNFNLHELFCIKQKGEYKLEIKYGYDLSIEATKNFVIK